GVDVVTVLERQDFPSDEPGDAGPSCRGDDECKTYRPWPQPYGEQQEQRDARDGDDDVHQPHQDAVDRAAEVPGYRADRETDGERGDERDARDLKGDTASVGQARQDIATVIVGAEDVLGVLERRSLDFRVVAARVVVTRDLGHDRRTDREEGEDDDHDEPEHRELVLAELAPGASIEARGFLQVIAVERALRRVPV